MKRNKTYLIGIIFQNVSDVFVASSIEWQKDKGHTDNIDCKKAGFSRFFSSVHL